VDFELKFKNSSRLEFDLNSKEFVNFDFIRSFIKMIRVQMKCLNFRNVTVQEATKIMAARFQRLPEDA
jgi:hypothetical protein